jgi:hypothetical protein
MRFFEDFLRAVPMRYKQSFYGFRLMRKKMKKLDPPRADAVIGASRELAQSGRETRMPVSVATLGNAACSWRFGLANESRRYAFAAGGASRNALSRYIGARQYLCQRFASKTFGAAGKMVATG